MVNPYFELIFFAIMGPELKRHRANPCYRINIYAIAPTHPLGIKPSGNALLSAVPNGEEINRKLLGDLARFPEDLLVELISYITDPQDLKNLGHCSRILYAYTYGEDHWRNLYLKEYERLEKLRESSEIVPFGSQKWRGSWRKSVLALDNEALVQANSLIFSDLLYRPYQCSNIDYTSLFKRIIDYERRSSEICLTLNTEFGVERFREGSLSLDDFQSTYINKPFILQADAGSNRWPKWGFDDLLHMFPEESFRQEAVQWKLSKYLEYAKNNRDESPLYLFDCKGDPMKKLSQVYEAPAIFKDDAFKLFQSGDVQCRPDHRWLIAGPGRSGSTFHKDPNHTSAWNAVLTGMKLWVMLPPDVHVPGVSTDKEEEEVTAPIGTSEWILSGFYNDAVKLAELGKCMITVTFPGECIYVPSGWWHSVINLTDCVAITENFVPEPLLVKVLSFLKDKPTQISGFHLKDLGRSVDAFLRNVQKEEASSDTENHMSSLKDFVQASKEQEFDNEDCGVKCESEVYVPVYEFFVELLKRSKHKEAAEMALEELKKFDQRNHSERVRDSEMWNELKKGSNKSFSFGFDLE